MPSPGSCSRCKRALAVESDGNLCPECLGAQLAETASLATGQFAKTPRDDDADSTRSITRHAVSADIAVDPREYLPESPPGYDLIRRLGAGGMGTVYLAHEHAAERTVAMKMLNSPSSPVAFDRFLVEARALARLDHPNIVKVISVETNWREPFLTMEYADGGTLADLTDAATLMSPAEAARLILSAAEAVAVAHAAGILHRDIKPSNILLHKAGSPQPKVSDFGLAKRTDRDDGLTRSSDPMGTPRYMSPEAAAGRYADVGPPADVYGLGATLYHLLTGRPPFIGETHNEVIQQVLHDVPTRPRALRPDLSPELEAIVVKAMEKNPAARYPTATALAEDLRSFLSGKPTVARVLSPSRRAWRWLGRHRKRIATVAGVLALVVLIAAAGRKFWKDPPPDPRDVMREEIANGKDAKLLGRDGRPRWSAWPIEPQEYDPTQDDGGTCSFNSKEANILLLLDDPGADSYEVQAEICQKQKLADVDRGINRDDCEVGLVLGYAGQNGVDGKRIHSLMVIRFVDYDADSPPTTKRWLELIHAGLVSAPGFAAGSIEIVRGDIPSTPLQRASDGRPWRTVFARVTPQGVWVPKADGTLKLAAVDAISESRTELHDAIAAGRTGPIEPFPAWSPRSPIGIWCLRSSVSIRNVTVRAIK